MSVPSELPEIGSTAQRLRQNPRFDPVAAAIGPEDYFVWTRFDGKTTLKDLILMTGFATPKAVDIVRKLRTIGAILLPNEKPEAVTPRVATRTPPQGVRVRPNSDAERFPVAGDHRPTSRVAATAAIAPEDAAAMAEDVEIDLDDRDRILTMHRRVKLGDPLATLGVGDASDKKEIKRAYFALSKEFHPDRYYRKRVGSFDARLTEIFEAINRAYAELSEDKPRRAGTHVGPAPAPPSPTSQRQSPTDHAAEIFDRACHAEVSGDVASALRLFAQALRLDAPARFLRRAARCALSAQEHRIALEYAKKAANLEPNDVSTARLLAACFKANGKLADAEETLVLALMIKSENDQLSHELQADLAEVRRLAAR